MVEYFLGYYLLLSENILGSFFYSFSPEEILGEKLLFSEEVLGTKLLDAEIILGDTFLFSSVFSNIIYLQHYLNTNTNSRIDDTLTFSVLYNLPNKASALEMYLPTATT